MPFLLGLVAIGVAVPAGAAPHGQVSAILTGPAVPNGHAYRKRLAIIALAKEGRALQLADGGALTPAHHTYLQGDWMPFERATTDGAGGGDARVAKEYQNAVRIQPALLSGSGDLSFLPGSRRAMRVR